MSPTLSGVISDPDTTAYGRWAITYLTGAAVATGTSNRATSGSRVSYSVPDGVLQAGGAYRWTMQACDDNGPCSTPTTPLTFGHQPTLASSELTGTATDTDSGLIYLTSVTPTFTTTSSDAAGQTHAEFEIWEDQPAQVMPVITGSSSAGQSGTWSPAGEEEHPIRFGHAYKWRARASNDVSTGPWSKWKTFTPVSTPDVTPYAPTNLSADALQADPAVLGLLRPTF